MSSPQPEHALLLVDLASQLQRITKSESATWIRLKQDLHPVRRRDRRLRHSPSEGAADQALQSRKLLALLLLFLRVRVEGHDISRLRYFFDYVLCFLRELPTLTLFAFLRMKNYP